MGVVSDSGMGWPSACTYSIVPCRKISHGKGEQDIMKDAAYYRNYRATKRNQVTETQPSATKVVQPDEVKVLRVDNKELRAEVDALRAEVSRLKQLLATRPASPIVVPTIRVPKGLVSPFSKAAQTTGKMPNNSPVGRMAGW